VAGARGTAKKQAAFLAAFAECGNVTRACEIAKVGRRTHYNWLEDPDYEAAFSDAENQAVDALEGEARRRALESSDTLLIFLLKSRRPELYRERHHVEHAGSVTFTVNGQWGDGS